MLFELIYWIDNFDLLIIKKRKLWFINFKKKMLKY